MPPAPIPGGVRNSLEGSGNFYFLFSFCVLRGKECHYSLRRKRRSSGVEKKLGGDKGDGAVKLGPVFGDRDKEAPIGHGRQVTPLMDWKRARLGASPATGLVGFKENTFLASFFNSVGFLPLTNESVVREAIMEVIFASPRRSGDTDQLCTRAPSAGRDAEERKAATAASTCVLWCSVAIGALVQGQPQERVAEYILLARQSLSQCFEVASAETARAIMIMAYLYNFLRDSDMFNRYLKFAGRVVGGLPDSTERREEIQDLLEIGDSTRVVFTPALEPGELDAFCEGEIPLIEIPDVMHKSALGRILINSERRVLAALLRDYRAQIDSLRGRQTSSSCEQEATNVENPSPLDWGHRRLPKNTERDALTGGEGDDVICDTSHQLTKVSMKSTIIDDDIAPIVPGEETSRLSKEVQAMFAPLRETAEIPEFRMGVGGVLYNAISGFIDIVVGGTSIDSGIEKAKRCAKIFVRFPGLCRFSTWTHMSHFLLSVLAMLPDAEPFEEMRQAYNSVRRNDAPEVPPHGEWTMVGFCDHIVCRCVDRLREERDTAARDLRHTGECEGEDVRQPYAIPEQCP